MRPAPLVERQVHDLRVQSPAARVDLHGRAVVGMPEQEMKYLGALLNVQRLGDFAAGTQARLPEYRAAMRGTERHDLGGD